MVVGERLSKMLTNQMREATNQMLVIIQTKLVPTCRVYQQIKMLSELNAQTRHQL